MSARHSLKGWRTRLGLTQSELAQYMGGGVSGATISNIECGRDQKHEQEARRALLQIAKVRLIQSRERREYKLNKKRINAAWNALGDHGQPLLDAIYNLAEYQLWSNNCEVADGVGECLPGDMYSDLLEAFFSEDDNT